MPITDKPAPPSSPDQAAKQLALGDLLWDLHAAGSKLQEYTEGGTAEGFAASAPLQALAASMIGLMADALGTLRRRFPEEAARLPGPAVDAVQAAALLLATPGRLWPVVEQAVPAVVAEARVQLEAWHGGEPDPRDGAAPRLNRAAEEDQRVVYDDAPAPSYDD